MKMSKAKSVAIGLATLLATTVLFSTAQAVPHLCAFYCSAKDASVGTQQPDSWGKHVGYTNTTHLGTADEQSLLLLPRELGAGAQIWFAEVSTDEHGVETLGSATITPEGWQGEGRPKDQDFKPLRAESRLTSKLLQNQDSPPSWIGRRCFPESIVLKAPCFSGYFIKEFLPKVEDLPDDSPDADPLAAQLARRTSAATRLEVTGASLARRYRVEVVFV
ncbi:MAG: hypothetical protein LBJ38_03290 [Oscillospiraceae bacterium]|jgi:hypothetical protein|nr:hypothetical protein [Oscillospiraceae bacterium]